MTEEHNQSCKIKIMLGNEVREELVSKAAFTIGRGRDADIQIVSPNISRVHLSVEIRDGAIWIADFGSANGSFINDREITSHQIVEYRPGDQIKLGEAKEILILEVQEGSLQSAGEINLDTKTDIPMNKAPKQVVAAVDHSAAERILSQAKAVAAQLKEAAEIEGQKIIGRGNDQAAVIIQEAEKTVAVRAEEIYSKAHQAGEKILSEYKPRGEKLLTDARVVANTIKTQAQEEADALLNVAYQKRNDVQSSTEELAKKIENAAHDKSEDILKDAQVEVDGLLREAQESSRKMRQKNEQDLEEIRKQSEFKAQQKFDQAKLESDKIIALASQLGESQKQNIILRANEEAKDIVIEAQRRAKVVAEEVTLGFQEEHVRLSQKTDNLNRDISRLEIQRADAERNYKVSNDELISTKLKQDEALKLFSDREILNKQHIAELESRVVTLDENLVLKFNEFGKIERETQISLDQRRENEETALALGNESESLRQKITEMQSHESQLSQKLSSLEKQIDQERVRLKEALDLEMSTLRKEVTADIKKMREQANVDHAKALASQDAELSHLRKKELDIIKSLRAESDAKAKLSRKHQAIEVARALEVYLTPRILDGLKSHELPQSLQNMFKDISLVVIQLMVEDSTNELTSINSIGSAPAYATSKNRKKVFAGVGAVAASLIAVAFYCQDKYGDHRTNAELYASELREKEAKKPKFTPSVTDEYKASYTDNVIFTNAYANFKVDSQNQSKWIKDLNKFFINNLNLNEDSVVKFIPIETELVTTLGEKRKMIHFETQDQDIKAMRDIEKENVDKITQILGGETNYKAFREFEKNYFQQNRMPASNQNPTPVTNSNSNSNSN